VLSAADPAARLAMIDAIVEEVDRVVPIPIVLSADGLRVW
jgi:hypothetical protein